VGTKSERRVVLTPVGTPEERAKACQKTLLRILELALRCWREEPAAERGAPHAPERWRSEV